MIDFQQLTDQQLLLLLKEGRHGAFKAIHERYHGLLYRHAMKRLGNREEVRDILQEVFIKVWRQIDQYDANKGRLFTWLVNISRNTSIDTLRSKSYNTQKQNRELTETVYNAAGSINTETDKIGLRKIVNRLKEDQKVLIELAYFHGYTQDEISKFLNIPLGTVKTRLRSALILLKDFLKN